MTSSPRPNAVRAAVTTVPLALLLAASPANAQEPYEPQVGQAGKDVVWVPTPPSLVERMMTMAQVGPGDVVFDLGSGDGRVVIAAAKRGAQAVGVEYNADMVALSRRNAEREHVPADKARFVQGDIFQADFSSATVVALYLLPEHTRIQGDAVSFGFVDGKGILHELEGRVTGSGITGTFRAGTRKGSWTAKRTEPRPLAGLQVSSVRIR